MTRLGLSLLILGFLMINIAFMAEAMAHESNVSLYGLIRDGHSVRSCEVERKRFIAEGQEALCR